MRKLIGILVVMLFCASSTSQVVGFISNIEDEKNNFTIFEINDDISDLNSCELVQPLSFNPDTLDQSSYDADSLKIVGPSDEELAQSFKPTLSVLTKVKLRLKSTGNAEFYYYYVDIKNSLLGSALTTAYISRSILVIGSGWYEFDFSDLSVTPGSTYYIILRGVSTSSDSSSVYWWYGYPTPYANGDAWYESISGWNYLKDGPLYCDYCFETYGLSSSNNPPNTPNTLSGPSSGSTEEELTYTSSTIDPDGDDIKYHIDVNNDGVIDHTSSYFYSSGATYTIVITFSGEGTYPLRLKAEDIYGAQSGWSTAKTVTIGGSSNNPPNTPSTPSGPSSGSIGSSYTYTTSSTDPDGDDISYGWDWDGDSIVDEYSTLLSSGAVNTMSHTWSSSGIYQVKVKAKDEHNSLSSFSSSLTVTISDSDNPPNTPSTPSGPSSGKIDTSYTYSTSTDDPDGDQVYYKWDWGDEISSWLGPYNSGDIVTVSHIWTNQGTFPLKVKAKDINDLESVWSDPISVSIPKNKPISFEFIRFIENFLNINSFIKYLCEFNFFQNIR